MPWTTARYQDMSSPLRKWNNRYVSMLILCMIGLFLLTNVIGRDFDTREQARQGKNTSWRDENACVPGGMSVGISAGMNLSWSFLCNFSFVRLCPDCHSVLSSRF